MTAQIYYTIDVEDLAPLGDFNARIGTVVDQDKNGKPVPISPCPADDTEKTVRSQDLSQYPSPS